MNQKALEESWLLYHEADLTKKTGDVGSSLSFYPRTTSGDHLFDIITWNGNQTAILDTILHNRLIQDDPKALESLDAFSMWLKNIMDPEMQAETIFYPPESFVGKNSTTTITPLNKTHGKEIEELKKACTPREVEDAFVEVDHEISLGIFIQDRIIAMASAFPFFDPHEIPIAQGAPWDIGVLIAPDYRSKGYGSQLINEISNRIIKNGNLPQIRALDQKNAIMSLAQKLGFVEFATILYPKSEQSL